MTSKILLKDLFCESACKMLSGLDVLGTLNRNSIKNFKFLQQVKNIKSVALLFRDRVSW